MQTQPPLTLIMMKCLYYLILHWQTDFNILWSRKSGTLSFLAWQDIKVAEWAQWFILLSKCSPYMHQKKVGSLVSALHQIAGHYNYIPYSRLISRGENFHAFCESMETDSRKLSTDLLCFFIPVDTVVALQLLHPTQHYMCGSIERSFLIRKSPFFAGLLALAG